MNENKIHIKQIAIWFFDQMKHPITLFKRKSWGVFSVYAHIRRSDHLPKKASPSKDKAIETADFMGKKYGGKYSIYKCVYCDGWHVAKDADVPQPDTAPPFIPSVEIPVTLDIERIIKLGIPDMATVYGGVRGRTMSSKHQDFAWPHIKEAGIRTIIDLRADGVYTRLKSLCDRFGIDYFYYPVDKKTTYINTMIDLFPELCRIIDKSNFYIACAMGLHRTDIALCCYWMFYAADKGIAPPAIRGYRQLDGHDTTKIRRVINDFYNAYFEKYGKYPISNEKFIERKKIIEQQSAK